MKLHSSISSSSGRGKKVISCIILVALLVLAIRECSEFLEIKTARDKYTPFYEAKTNFDVIFLGSSHMYNTVYPMELWKDYGISSFNWGYADCSPCVEYYLIQDLIKYTSPKVVVVDVFGIVEFGHWTKFQSDAIGLYHVQFDRMPLSKVKIDAVKDAFDAYPHRNDFLFNLMLYHNRWSILTKEDFDPVDSPEMGASICTDSIGRTSYERIPDDLKSDELYGFNYDAYLKLIEFCNERGIQVVSVYTPCAAQEFNQRIANTLGEIVEAYPNCRYYNMLNEGIVNFETDVIADNEHLNYSGASKVTEKIGQYLRDNYELDDYSGDENWTRDYDKYLEFKKSLIRQQKCLPVYLPHLIDDDFDTEAVIYDKRVLEFDQMIELFKNAGIDPVLEEADGDVCAALKIRSRDSGEIVEDVKFRWEDPDDPEMLEIIKIEE